MNKLPILSLDRNKVGERSLPRQFQESYRPDLIRRAVHALQSRQRQAYGAKPEAGLRHAHDVSKRRRDYKTSYGKGISRVARKVHTRRGMQMNWVGTFSPQTVGGRRAHPPKAEKQWTQKINLKENRKAIRSALAATVNRQVVEQRGHTVPENYPFIVDTALETVTKTKAVEKALQQLGFAPELERSSLRKVRAGKGKLRGRKYRKKKGLLIVVSGDCPLLQAGRNLPGVDVATVSSLNAGLLAPGTLPGRITLWTEQALELLEQKNLFT